MNCETFATWLDEGRPPFDRDQALRHVEACSSCADELAAARALDEVLAQRLESAPASFAADVLARLPEQPATTPDVESVPEIGLPWWARILTEPLVILSIMLATLVAGWGGSLLMRGSEAITIGLGAIGDWSLPAAYILGYPFAGAVAAAVTVVGFGLGTWGLYRAALSFSIDSYRG